MRLIQNPSEADDADKACFARNFDDPLPKPVLVPVRPRPHRPRFARCQIWERSQKFHNRRVGRHRRKRRHIIITPWPQQQTLGA
jgi:hypothetical protein